MQRRKILLAIFTVLGLLAGCGKSVPVFDDAYTVITKPTFSPDTLGVPISDEILTITGQIKQTNDGDILHLDKSMVESFGVVEYTLTDPFEERDITFRGVLMRDLLEAIEVSPNASTIKLVALNDYAIEVPISEMRDTPIMYALQADGHYMQPDYRGPAMLVYPIHMYKNWDSDYIQDNWIWQIKAIEIL